MAELVDDCLYGYDDCSVLPVLRKTLPVRLCGIYDK